VPAGRGVDVRAGAPAERRRSLTRRTLAPVIETQDLDDLPVADPWFVTTPVGDGITHITEPHVHPLLRCNVWHARGRDRDVVVDTSLGLRPLRHLVEHTLGHGIVAVATHVHGDHVGGMHEFDERAIHGAEAAELASRGSVRLLSSAYGPLVLGPYRDAGYDVPDLLVDAVPAGGLDDVVLERPPAPATVLLDDGDVIDLGDRTFEVLHVPGHSPGSIALWEAATGVLFTGDAVYDGPLLDELDGSDIPAYVDTMRRMRELPVRVVHAGHEPSFGRERLVELCDAYLALRA
jgi:glyoxylase-like metal-dependent hydrolase (beta-lactamase superfamily II)